MLYRQDRVTRIGVPLPPGSGPATRRTRDVVFVVNAHGEAPPSKHAVVESIAAAIAFGVHVSAEPVRFGAQRVSPMSGRDRREARCGESTVTGARTSAP